MTSFSYLPSESYGTNGIVHSYIDLLTTTCQKYQSFLTQPMFNVGHYIIAYCFLLLAYYLALQHYPYTIQQQGIQPTSQPAPYCHYHYYYQINNACFYFKDASIICADGIGNKEY